MRATARARDRPESEGTIVELKPPSSAGQPALVVIRTESRHRWVVAQEAVQVKGVDYGWEPRLVEGV